MRPSQFELEVIFERYEHDARMNVLGASDAETLTVGELLRMTDAPLDLGSIPLDYGKVRGCDELREAVAKSYGGARISAENVLITTGASEAILLALHTLLKPHDTALVCRPAYQALYEMAEATGARVLPYYYRESDSNGRTVFTPDLALAERMLGGPQPPRLLVLNTPHNPTGHVIKANELESLLASARGAGAHIVVDEVFAGISIGSAEQAPSVLALDSEAIVIGCLSKVYGLAGLRVGWLIGPQSFIEGARNLRFYTSLVPPKVVQELATIAVKNRDRILARTQRNVDENYAYVTEWLDDEKHRDLLTGTAPQGGLVMLLRLKKDVNTREFAETLAAKHKVFLVPCTSGFGMADGYLRLGLGSNPGSFKKGLRVLSGYLLSD